MSIASQITRLTTLRNTIRTKLKTLGIISNDSASLSDCSTAINNLSKVTPSTPATTVTVTPTISNPTTAGVITVSGSVTASVKPTSAKGYSDGTSTAGTIKATASGTKTITTQGAQTITPGTSNKTIAAGRWLTGTQTIAGSSNLIASNIKSGVNIFGVTGTATEGCTKRTYAANTLTLSTQSCADFKNVTTLTGVKCVAVDVTNFTPILWISPDGSAGGHVGIADTSTGNFIVAYYMSGSSSWYACIAPRSGNTMYIPAPTAAYEYCLYGYST